MANLALYELLSDPSGKDGRKALENLNIDPDVVNSVLKQLIHKELNGKPGKDEESKNIIKKTIEKTGFFCNTEGDFR